MSTVTLEICSGREGPSAYVNDYRCAGPKPWGGGRIMHTFRLSLADLATAVGRKKYDPEQVANKLKEYGRACEKVGKSRDENGKSHDWDAINEMCRLESELKALMVLPAIEQRMRKKGKEKEVAA